MLRDEAIQFLLVSWIASLALAMTAFFIAAALQDVDARDIGERKRRRSSNGYTRA
jgi:hypothetical protein